MFSECYKFVDIIQQPVVAVVAEERAQCRSKRWIPDGKLHFG